MEAMQADGLLDDTLFQKSTGMRNPDGKTGGRLDRLKKQREEKLMDGKNKLKTGQFFQPGRDTLNKGNVIPAASTGLKSREHLSTAPISGIPPVKRARPNAEAGPSQPRIDRNVLATSRRGLTSGQGKGDDYNFVEFGHGYSTRGSASPEKPTQDYSANRSSRSSNNYNAHRPPPTATPITRTDATFRSKQNAGGSGERNHPATASTGGSVSPRKRTTRSQRPIQTDDSAQEEFEEIEDPNGSFKNGDRDSDVEYIPPKAHNRSTKKSSRSASPTKPAATIVSSKGKGKASAQQPLPEDLRERVNTGDENESHARPLIPRSNPVIPSSGVSGGIVRCNTKVVWCRSGKDGTIRRMGVSQVELHGDGIALCLAVNGSKVCRSFIKATYISRAETCEDPECPLILIKIDLQVGTKVDIIVSSLKRLIEAGHNKYLEPPDVKDVHRLEIGIPLESAAPERYIYQFRGMMLRNQCAKPQALSAELCNALQDYAPKTHASADSPSVSIAALSTSPPVSRPIKKIAKEVASSSKNVPQRMAERVQGFDDALALSKSDKAKGKERIRQSALKFEPFDQNVIPIVDKRTLPVRKTRHSGQQIIDDICSDNEVVPEPPRAPVLAPPPDRGTVLFPYPLTGRASLNITKGELWRVQSGEFLNDTLIEWGLKHLIDELTDYDRDPNVHLFNSFFYTKISSKDQDKKGNETEAARWPAYETVRKWTKSVDVFSKKFIIVPINEDFHWYLAVIFNPGGMLVDTSAEAPILDPTENVKVDATTPITSEESPDVSDEKSVDAQLETSAATPDDTQESIVAIPKPDEPMDVDSGDMTAEIAGDKSTEIDELDCLPPRNEPSTVRRMSELKIEEPKTSLRAKKPVPQGQAISTSTLVAFEAQDQMMPSGSEPVKSEPRPEPEAIKPVSKKAVPPDHIILKSQKPWVITFDSLGSQHKGVGRYLNDWLQWEARTKQGEQYGNVEVEYTHAQVPLQANFSDCGLYLVHYARRLLTEPDNILKFVERRLPHKSTEERKQFDIDMDSTWKVSRDHNLRDEWQAAIISLKEAYDELQARDARVAGDEAKSEGGQGEAVEGDSVDDVMLVAQPGLEPEQATEGATEGGETSGLTNQEDEEVDELDPEVKTAQAQEEATPIKPDVPDQGGNDEIVAERSSRPANSLGLDQYGSRDTSDSSPPADAPENEEVDELDEPDEPDEPKSESNVPRGGFSPGQIATALNAADPANDERFLGKEDDVTSTDLQAESNVVSSSAKSTSDHQGDDDDERRGGFADSDDVDPTFDDYKGPGQTKGNLEDEVEMEQDTSGERFLSSSPDSSDTRPQMIKDAGLNHPLNPNAPSATSNVTIDNSNVIHHQVKPGPPENDTRTERYQGNTRDDAIEVDDDVDNRDDDGNQEDDDNHEDDDKENAPPLPERQISACQHTVPQPPAVSTSAPSSSRDGVNPFECLIPSAAHRKYLAQNRAAPVQEPPAPSSPLSSIPASRDEEETTRNPPPSPFVASSSGSTAKAAPPASSPSVPPWLNGRPTGVIPSRKLADIDPPSSSAGTPVKRTTRSNAPDIMLVDSNGQVDDLESRSSPEGDRPSRSRPSHADVIDTPGSARAFHALPLTDDTTQLDVEVSEPTDLDLRSAFDRPGARVNRRNATTYKKNRTVVDGPSTQDHPFFTKTSDRDSSLSNVPSVQKRQSDRPPRNSKTKKPRQDESGQPGNSTRRLPRAQAQQARKPKKGDNGEQVPDNVIEIDSD